ncbi:hypothetical protein [Mycobacterium riyadhense]|uniref:hypothetical protein n=1 Tax=Mycobacterium riyadhense TaxID=486698 RepID=UPI00194E123A|nr:hypothetical protein [Mycobacterium riyadhense]
MTTTDWRDYADQLTEEQVAELERLEAPRLVEFSPPLRPLPAARLVEIARDYVADNGAQVRLAHVPPPAGFDGLVCDWGLDQGESWYRYVFDGPRRITERDAAEPLNSGVEAGARQWEDGRVTDPGVYIGDSVYTPAGARKFARALIDAADAAERAAGASGGS